MESTTVSSQRIISAKRWDFEYFDPSYMEVIKRINESGWPVKRLGEIVITLTDGQHGYLEHLPSGIPLLRTSNVFENEIRLDDVRYIAPEVHFEIKRSQLKPGDVLLTTIGSIGLAAVVDKNLGEANINQNLVKITPKPEINPTYLAVFFNSDVGRTQIVRTASKSVVPIVNYARLKDVIVPVPPREVQDRIARLMQEAYASRQAKLAQAHELLNGIDDFLLRKLGVNLKKLENHRAVLKPIHAIAGGRFDFEAVVTAQEMDFNDTPSTQLSEVVALVNERITPALESTSETVNYVGLENIASNTGQLTEFVPVPASQVLSSSPKFKQGDILFGRMRPYLNKVWIAEFDGICSGEIIVLRPDDQKVNTQFLHALLLSRTTLSQVVPLQSGTSLPRVSASDVLKIKLPIPNDKNLQITVAEEIYKRQVHAKNLVLEAEKSLIAAKAQVERMILGEEGV